MPAIYSMRDVVTTALRRIGVIESGATPSSKDAEDTLSIANGILAQLSAQDIHTGSGVLGLNDEFPLEFKHWLGFTSYLARHIAPDFGVTASREIEDQAVRGWNLIAADYMAPESLRADMALTCMPSQRRWR